MTGPAKRKGDAAEREVAALITNQLGIPARRMLGAGRTDDIGDIDGVPDTTIQVAAYKDLSAALRIKVDGCTQQQERAGNTFGATFLRRPGGRYFVALTPDQFFTLWRAATK